MLESQNMQLRWNLNNNNNNNNKNKNKNNNNNNKNKNKNTTYWICSWYIYVCVTTNQMDIYIYIYMDAKIVGTNLLRPSQKQANQAHSRSEGPLLEMRPRKDQQMRSWGEKVRTYFQEWVTLVWMMWCDGRHIGGNNLEIHEI